MITNSLLIRDSLGLIGVFAETQTASVEQTELGMRVLNEMLADWKADSIDLQYTPQSVAGATTPIPDSAISAVKHFLGLALAPYFGVQPGADMLGLSEKYYLRLVRESVIDQLKEIKPDLLPFGESQRWFVDISNI